MKYSKALRECIESAFLVASHFGAEYLESWHLLIAMANHGYSVAGATLNEFPYEIDRLEEVAVELTETKYSDKEHYQELPFSHRLKVLLLEAEHVASVVHAKVLGTEHVLYAILHDGNALATRILAISTGTSPLAMRWARPSARAVLPTPASPTRTGLFFVLRLKI